MATYKHRILTYTGDGNAARAITGAGFEPDLVMLKAHGGGAAAGSLFRHKDNTGTISQRWTGAPLASQGIESLDADGFTVGTDNRANQINVKYVALCVWEGTGEFFRAGTYEGNGSDDVDIEIDAAGWQPTFMFVKNEDNQPAVFRSEDHVGDDSSALENDGNFVDYIQAFNANGFQVGGHVNVNQVGTTYFYFAWRNLNDELVSYFSTGTYTGNGGNLTVSGGITINPSWVMVKVTDGAGNDANWRHTSHPGGNGSSWGSSGNSAFFIKSFLGASFSVGFLASILDKTHHFLATVDEANIDVDLGVLAVTDISPAIGLTRGQTLMTITGSGFEPGVKVTFDVVDNEDATEIVRVSENVITCRSPAHAAGLVHVVVTNPVTEDNAFIDTPDAFTFIEPSVTPSSGPKVGGTEVTIAGADFIEGQRVFFDGVEATQVEFVDSQTLIVITPVHPSGVANTIVEET